MGRACGSLLGGKSPPRATPTLCTRSPESSKDDSMMIMTPHSAIWACYAARKWAVWRGCPLPVSGPHRAPGSRSTPSMVALWRKPGLQAGNSTRSACPGGLHAALVQTLQPPCPLMTAGRAPHPTGEVGRVATHVLSAVCSWGRKDRAPARVADTWTCKWRRGAGTLSQCIAALRNALHRSRIPCF